MALPEDTASPGRAPQERVLLSSFPSGSSRVPRCVPPSEEVRVGGMTG